MADLAAFTTLLMSCFNRHGGVVTEVAIHWCAGNLWETQSCLFRLSHQLICHDGIVSGDGLPSSSLVPQIFTWTFGVSCLDFSIPLSHKRKLALSDSIGVALLVIFPTRFSSLQNRSNLFGRVAPQHVLLLSR